jgi:putative transcriptional regulator
VASRPRLREARQQAGLTQQQLARQLGVDQSVIARYESGMREPRVSMAVRLAAAVASSVEAIWTADDEGPRRANGRARDPSGVS